MIGNYWTPAEIQALKDLRAAGYRFSMIGRLLKRTRNSCIGQATRQRIGKPERERSWQEDFSDALAETGSIDKAAKAVGIAVDKGHSRFRQICKELGWQSR